MIRKESLVEIYTDNIADFVGYEVMVVNNGRTFSTFKDAAIRMKATKWKGGYGNAPKNWHTYVLKNYIYDPEFHPQCLALIGDDEVDYVIGVGGLKAVSEAGRMRSIWKEK